MKMPSLDDRESSHPAAGIGYRLSSSWPSQALALYKTPCPRLSNIRLSYFGGATPCVVRCTRSDMLQFQSPEAVL
jgi:hypothetical protein